MVRWPENDQKIAFSCLVWIAVIFYISQTPAKLSLRHLEQGC